MTWPPEVRLEERRGGNGGGSGLWRGAAKENGARSAWKLIVVALELDPGSHWFVGSQRPGGDVASKLEGQPAQLGPDRVQLDFPGASQRQGEVAEVVADERARGVGVAAARFVEVQDDLAARGAVGKVELAHLERDVLMGLAREGGVELLTRRRNDGSHRRPAGQLSAGQGSGRPSARLRR